MHQVAYRWILVWAKCFGRMRASALTFAWTTDTTGRAGLRDVAWPGKGELFLTDGNPSRIIVAVNVVKFKVIVKAFVVISRRAWKEKLSRRDLMILPTCHTCKSCWVTIITLMDRDAPLVLDDLNPLPSRHHRPLPVKYRHKFHDQHLHQYHQYRIRHQHQH